MAPISWFPFKRILDRRSKVSEVPEEDVINGIQTFYPRYLMIPRVGRSLYGLLFFLSIILPALRIHKEFKFDAIFATWAYPDSFAAVLLSKLLKKPILAKVHGTDINEYSQYWLRRKMISFALNNSWRVISVSKALRDRMIEIGVKSRKIRVVYNGVDSELFKPTDRMQVRRELEIDTDKKVILFVGNLKPVKGLTYLIRAFAGVAADTERNAALFIIGDGELREDLENQVKDQGMQDCVYIPGSKAHHEIPRWMNACDVLCLPSLSEGVPNVILEAFACGVPVVASKVGGIPEILTSHDLGRLLQPEDPEELRKALLECLDKSWERELIRAYSDKFSWRHNAEIIYQEIMDIFMGNGD